MQTLCLAQHHHLKGSDAAANLNGKTPMILGTSCLHAETLSDDAYAGCRYQQGAPLSPLDGVPFAVIDCLHAGPYPTTAGTKQVQI